MSYASVASHNIPDGEMPKPDQSLLDGAVHSEHETSAIHLEDKLNVLPAGTDLEHPPVDNERSPRPEPVQLSTSADPAIQSLHVAPEPAAVPKGETKWDKAEKKAEGAREKGKEYTKKAKKELHEAEARAAPYWDRTKEIILRPSTLGGLVGVVNVGLLGGLGYLGYKHRNQVWDRRIVGGAIAGTLALFSAEGYVADSYLHTPEGKQEADRARREGSKLYLQAREVILRPGVAGGLAGLFNVAVLSTVGYFSYKNWNHPWDRRLVSAVTVGLLGLSGVEGYIGKAYTENELPKH